ncbi:MAG: N-acetylglucosamine-6-phosphate deacetylase [Ruminococcaceae bacterium]|nr:N-acetylglucosamine-6-phosphate deacetylase [Oscillospiraceae bacterium]
MKNGVLKNVLVGDTLTDITVNDGVITHVGKTSLEGEDLGGARVVAGLLDIHTHGCVGEDLMYGDLAAIARYERAHGITAFLPTTMAAPIEEIRRVTAECPVVEDGAVILGYHMEGPYLAEKYKGAQPASVLKAPDLAEFATLPHVRVVTVAPELDGAVEFIEKCGCPVFLGHTAAGYDMADEAFRAGAAGLTHTFNAMSPLHHRDPGPIGAAIDHNAYVQVIGDGVHLHPAVVRMLYRLFGAERMVLISDSMAATGMADGEYMLGSQHTVVKDGAARLKENGALAGSTTNLWDVVQRVIGMGIPPADAFRMASETPARLLGEKRGVIAEGYAADLVVVDEDYNVVRVM